MKILITTDWYAPIINGVVTSVLNLRRELLLRGHDVRVLTLSQNMRSFESDGVTYIGSVGVGKIYPDARIKTAFFSKFVQDIVDWQPDLIHSQCEFSTFFLARKIAKKLDIPIMHTYHTVYENYTHYFSPNKKWGRLMVAFMSRYIANRTACGIAPMEKMKTILKSYGINRNIHVIPTGVDMSRFSESPVADRTLAIKKQFGIPENNRILLYVGRLAKEKNLDELLRYHAKQRPEAVTFLIVGDGPYRAELERMTEDLGIGNSVKFTGMISPNRIIDYYHAGDLFVSASISETQGLTYIEALSAGLPVLCRRDECLTGVVLNGKNGWLYENEQDYFEKTEAFMRDAETRKTMSENAIRLSRQMFSAAAFAERAESVYLGMLGRSTENGAIVCSSKAS
ncbi:MAG: glycosyltransferase family 4 protein [Clostridiales Family XIII bacterium]|jgi:1,2-diacylglycerol 3-alpha-glucosyltransferase|nr:glycosyltransferase family 4 protein [Clostridiales Family XIII bacterium]